MALRRARLELSVERELPADGPDPPGRARLSAEFELPEGAPEPTEAELREAMDRLRRELDGAVGHAPARADRELAELVETYRPRQSELVDLLRDEGELTAIEHGRLQEYLAAGKPPFADRSNEAARDTPPSSAARAELSPPTPSSLAAAPVESDRTPSTTRPVSILLEQYQISSLKQAGAVRARRQISYEEYMALKRHFGGPAAVPAAPAGQ